MLGVLGRMLCSLQSQLCWVVYILILTVSQALILGALFFLRLPGTKRQDRIYPCAGDVGSKADSYFVHPLYLPSWLPKPALDPAASKAELKLLSLVPGYQPPGYLLVKSTAGIGLTGSTSVRLSCCTEGISSPALGKLVTALLGLRQKEHSRKAKSESTSPGSSCHWLTESWRQP